MAAGDATSEGLMRLLFTDASETEQKQIDVYPTAVLDLATDPRQLQVMAMSQGSVGQDDKIIMQVRSTVATTVATDPTESATHSLIRIPTTVKNTSTGNVFNSVLTSSDFNASATNYDVPANRWTTVGTYTVPAQVRVRLGGAIADNSRIRAEFKTSV